MFDAAATPHASFEVPGEDALAEVRALLVGWLKGHSEAEAWSAVWRKQCSAATSTLPFQQSPELLVKRLAGESLLLLREACAADPSGEGRGSADEVRGLAGRVRDVLRRSERVSLEMRCASVVVPRDPWLAVGGTLGLAIGCLLAWASCRRHGALHPASSFTNKKIS